MYHHSLNINKKIIYFPRAVPLYNLLDFPLYKFAETFKNYS